MNRAVPTGSAVILSVSVVILSESVRGAGWTSRRIGGCCFESGCFESE
jgi:hypothetical protein